MYSSVQSFIPICLFSYFLRFVQSLMDILEFQDKSPNDPKVLAE